MSVLLILMYRVQHDSVRSIVHPSSYSIFVQTIIWTKISVGKTRQYIILRNVIIKFMSAFCLRLPKQIILIQIVMLTINVIVFIDIDNLIAKIEI